MYISRRGHIDHVNYKNAVDMDPPLPGGLCLYKNATIGRLHPAIVLNLTMALQFRSSKVVIISTGRSLINHPVFKF